MDLSIQTTTAMSLITFVAVAFAIYAVRGAVIHHSDLNRLSQGSARHHRVTQHSVRSDAETRPREREILWQRVLQDVPVQGDVICVADPSPGGRQRRIVQLGSGQQRNGIDTQPLRLVQHRLGVARRYRKGCLQGLPFRSAEAGGRGDDHD